MKFSAVRAIYYFISLTLVNLGTAGGIAPAGLLSLYTVVFVVVGYMVLIAAYFVSGG